MTVKRLFVRTFVIVAEDGVVDAAGVGLADDNVGVARKIGCEREAGGRATMEAITVARRASIGSTSPNDVTRVMTGILFANDTEVVDPRPSVKSVQKSSIN